MTAELTLNPHGHTARSIFESTRVDLGLKLSGAPDVVAASQKLRAMGSLHWISTLSQVVAMVWSFLDDIDVAKVMVVGWAKQQELRSAGAHTFGTTESEEVELEGRNLLIRQRPSIEIKFLEEQVARLEFELCLKVAVQGVTAIVREGKLKELTGGRCTVTATVNVAGEQVAETPPRIFDPHVMVALGDGYPLTGTRGQHRAIESVSHG